ncbi:hypothetical protein DL98DRAFT_542667 [Cadophora sp. DSE1049]|nr:hypothetical protein DL98DRAFT_542667 [Cadophora sp. DSE1049]
MKYRFLGSYRTRLMVPSTFRFFLKLIPLRKFNFLIRKLYLIILLPSYLFVTHTPPPLYLGNGTYNSPINLEQPVSMELPFAREFEYSDGDMNFEFLNIPPIPGPLFTQPDLSALGQSEASDSSGGSEVERLLKEFDFDRFFAESDEVLQDFI